MTNELSGQSIPCAPSALVPQGPGVQLGYQGCAIAGTQVDSTSVQGETYLQTQYNYSRSNLWRNFAVVIAFGILYILVTVYASETISFTSSGGGALVFKKPKKVKRQPHVDTNDEEKARQSENTGGLPVHQTKTQDEVLAELGGCGSNCTWLEVTYTVSVPGGNKRLLNDVCGYAKPGVMVALMGASGAGKTTLLNTLSQRQKVGVITGAMLVDGRPLNADFQRSIEFVEQMDLHDETATVREAIEFSAILRQKRTVPRHEKIEYVNNIIDLLELVIRD